MLHVDGCSADGTVDALISVRGRGNPFINSYPLLAIGIMNYSQIWPESHWEVRGPAVR